MVKNSQKHKKRKAERADNRIAWEVAQLEQSKKLPSKVALPEHLHSLNYQLNFEQYNHAQCELERLVRNSAEALITKLSEITTYNSRNIAGSSLIRRNVNNAGSYKGLFKGLAPDIEMKEIKFAGTGRIFCHLINDHPDSDGRVSNYCCVLAIKTDHVDIH